MFLPPLPLFSLKCEIEEFRKKVKRSKILKRNELEKIMTEGIKQDAEPLLRI